VRVPALSRKTCFKAPGELATKPTTKVVGNSGSAGKTLISAPIGTRGFLLFLRELAELGVLDREEVLAWVTRT